VSKIESVCFEVILSNYVKFYETMMVNKRIKEIVLKSFC
jgi:hypothetical protein